MAGYTRNDTNNNIATGNVIRAADLDGEFDAVETAFNGSTGHNHDGTSGQGGPITKLGPGQNATVTSQAIIPAITDAMDLGTDNLRYKDGYFERSVIARGGFVGNITGNLTGSVVGNASTASTLESARTISLEGDVTGSVAFDGGANVSIIANVVDDSHNHVISDVDGLQTNLNNLSSSISDLDTSLRSYVDSSVSSLVDSAPGSLDTLNELAEALNDDADFAGTITTSIGTKAPLASPTFTGTPRGPNPAANSNNTQLATTAFVQNFVGGAVPAGVIVMWSGTITNVPSGWVLCNGSNNTPDLRNRFVVGAGSTYSPNAMGGSANAIVPSHTHTFSDSFTTASGGGHSHTATVSDPGHTHTIGAHSSNYISTPAVETADRNVAARLTVSGAINAATTGIQVGVNSVGGHTHTGSVSGTTNSAGSSATNANLPPYYALAYIMKT